MELLEKIKNRQALVGIIGLGYVGLPLVLRFCEVGFPVLGFDTDARKVEMLNRGEEAMLTIRNFGQKSLAELREKLVAKNLLKEEAAPPAAAESSGEEG